MCVLRRSYSTAHIQGTAPAICYSDRRSSGKYIQCEPFRSLPLLWSMTEPASPSLLFNEANVCDAHLTVHCFTHVIHGESCDGNSSQSLHLDAGLTGHTRHAFNLDSAHTGIQAK